MTRKRKLEMIVKTAMNKTSRVGMYDCLYNEQRKTRVLIGLEEYM